MPARSGAPSRYVFRLMYAALGITAKHFRGTYVKQLLKVLNEYDRQILGQPGAEAAFCAASAESASPAVRKG
jgi:hypothetical protein